MIIIFSYNRPEPLMKVLLELKGMDQILVIDDGSTYDYSQHEKHCTYRRTSHKGKRWFWTQWWLGFQMCKESDHDRFIFLPDDMCNFDWERLQWVFEVTGDRFACNVADVGWTRSWTPIYKQPSDIDGLFRCGWMDQGTITNRATLEALEWKIYPVSKTHFSNNNSSGVGKQVSTRLFNLNIPMYLPYTSMADFQDVPSVMHPQKKGKAV